MLRQKQQPKKKKVHAPVFTAALFTTAQTWKQSKCPSTEEWLPMWYTPRDSHTEWSQVRDRQICNNIYVQSGKMVERNLSAKQKHNIVNK